jgi:hypothetical protein
MTGLAGAASSGVMTAPAGDRGRPPGHPATLAGMGLAGMGLAGTCAAGGPCRRWRALCHHRRGLCGGWGWAARSGRRCRTAGARPAAVACQQWEAAQGDAHDDGHAPGDLRRADRVAEGDGAGHRADQGLEIEEGAGHFGRYPALPVGEEREGQQRPAERQAGGSEGNSRAVRCGGHALDGHRERQHREGSPEELHGGDRDRVAARQQADLRHGEASRQQQ